MSRDPKKIKPPSPLQREDRTVEVPPTVGKYDTKDAKPVPLDKTRADFREEEFTRVLRQHGKFIVWRKAMLCPCWNDETDQPSVDCEDCNQSGYIYVHPLQIQAWMAQFDGKIRLYEKFGIWQEAQVSITTEAKHRLGYRDSIEMRDSVIPFQEIIFKRNRRGPRVSLPEGVDSARFRIRNIASAVHKTKGGALAFLEEGTHFTITREGWIQWTAAGDRAVPDGDAVSLYYEFHPIFLVLSWFHVTRDDTSARKAPPTQPRIISNPVQAMAKLDFLVDPYTIPSMLPDSIVPKGTGVENPEREPASA